jgi:hypothetical protein
MVRRLHVVPGFGYVRSYRGAPSMGELFVWQPLGKGEHTQFRVGKAQRSAAESALLMY